MSALDRGRRIADRTVVDALGWTAGTRLHLAAARTDLALRAAIDGVLAVKAQRYLWLHAATRQWLGLRPVPVPAAALLFALPWRWTSSVGCSSVLDERGGRRVSPHGQTRAAVRRADGSTAVSSACKGFDTGLPPTVEMAVRSPTGGVRAPNTDTRRPGPSTTATTTAVTLSPPRVRHLEIRHASQLCPITG
jgi:hypothetical protein